MSNVDDAAKTVSLQAHLVGLWLATKHIKSISPGFGIKLLDVAVACQEQLVSETDSVIVSDVSRFIRALRLVAGTALVHDAAILDQMVNAVGPAQEHPGAGKGE